MKGATLMPIYDGAKYKVYVPTPEFFSADECNQRHDEGPRKTTNN